MAPKSWLLADLAGLSRTNSLLQLASWHSASPSAASILRPLQTVTTDICLYVCNLKL